ncbi:helix-turn-helix transcriptional regulator [Actinomadura hibisca]|uniref:helix-turn-helix transcriptional regulator n=1 Tax=Actinomadura hibisca TaxID=68565 RepID=UPI000A8B722E|nr:helix-turn-helix transcriptional regulator [Actinomadura hibisca]
MGTPNLAERLRSVRKRRGFTQQELAALSGVSVSLIRKLEQEERNDTRLETLHKLARALHVPTSDLLVGREQEETFSEDWSPVRDALLQKDALSGALEEPPTLQGVRRALGEAMPLFSRDHYSELVRVLPPLVREADALGEEGRSIRSRVLHHAGWLLTQTRQLDAAELALRRALDEATDHLDGAAVVNTWCWLLIRQGDLRGALDLAAEWADEVEPRMSRATMAELSVWGWLLIRRSAAAVRDNQPGEAEDAIRLARTAAVAMNAEYTPEGDFLRSFGPLTVAMKRAENAMVQDRPDQVITLAEKIPSRDLRPTSNNRNRHLLDVAKARTQLRQYPEAFEILQDVRRDAPEWITNQRYAKDILGAITAKRRKLTPEMRELADFLDLQL